MHLSSRPSGPDLFIHARVAVIASVLLPACNQLEAIEEDSGGGGGVPPVVQLAFEESCGKSGCHGESGPTAPVLAGAGIANLIGTDYIQIGDLAGSRIALQMLPDPTLAELGVTRPNPLRMPLDLDYFNPNNYIILAWIGGAEFEGGGGMATTGGEGSTGGEESTGPSEPLLPTWTNVFETVIPTCSCHYAPGSGALVFMNEKQSAYDAIVMKKSGQAPMLDYVTPMAPDDSYLLQKMEPADGIVGGPMPFGSMGAPADHSDLVRRWIEAGAPND